MNESPFDTVCKDCYFAEYEGITQVDCTMGRLDKFRKAGVDVLECTDNDKEFFVIKERICNYLRPQNWDSGETPLIKVIMESFIKMTFVVYIDDTKSLDNIYSTVRSIFDLECGFNRPHIRFVLKNDNIKSSQIVKHMYENYSDENNKQIFKWWIDTIYEETKEKALDLSIKNVKTQYFIVCDAGYTFNTNPIEVVDTYINEKMGTFLIATSEEFYIAQTKVYKLVNGNDEYSFEKKIEELAEQYNQKHLIKDYSEICSTISV